MAGSGIEIIGMSAIQNRFQTMRSRARAINRAATEEAIVFLEGKAKEILDHEVYGKSHVDDPDPPDKADGDSLYNAFKHAFNAAAGATVIGDLVNTSDHAGFIEDGTDEEGTGNHFVPVGAKGFLAWSDGGGNYAFTKKGHYVQGIKPLRFMARALSEHHAEVRAIFEKHFKEISR